MKNPKQKVEYKKKESPSWEKLVNALLASTFNVGFYPKDGEIRITLDEDIWFDLVLKADGTWTLE